MAAHKPREAPYGTWDSPLDAAGLAGGNLAFKSIKANADTRQIYVLEGRPSEGGRSCIVEYNDKLDSRDVLPGGYSATSTVHEYGGGAFDLAPDGTVVFSDSKKRGASESLLCPSVFSLNHPPSKVTSIIQHEEDIRYADFNHHPTKPWILMVQEDHTKEPCENTVVAVDSSTGAMVTVAHGADFYQAPRFSPDGKFVCWVQWSHPHMCWRGTQLFIADWSDGKVSNPRKLAGEEGQISVWQPRWGFDGSLYFVSDETGWWQLYRLKPGQTQPIHVSLAGLEKVDFAAQGQILGSRTYVPLSADALFFAVTQLGRQRLILVHPDSSSWSEFTDTITSVNNEAMARLSDSEVAFLGASPSSAPGVYVCSIKTGDVKLLKTSLSLDSFPDLTTDHISIAQHASFPRVHGGDQDGQAHAFYIPPKNPAFTAPEGTKPPCILWCHGGPHGSYPPGLDLTAQYFTTRGYAYVGVNYTGSIGYGRAFLESLYGNWGTLDTADCASCVRFLADQGLVDPARVGIVGGSAGGYSVLQGVCDYPDVYAGGVSIYGVSSLEGLMTDMHKYEAKYCEELVFKPGMTDEEKAEVLEKRSPYLNADKIKAPLLLLQGDADTVVPMSQTVLMEKVMKERGSIAEVVIFKDEGHGFKKKESIKATLELQEKWWQKTLLSER